MTIPSIDGRSPNAHDISARYIREATGARYNGLHAFEVQWLPSRRVNVWRWFLGGAVTILLGGPFLAALIAVAGAR